MYINKTKYIIYALILSVLLFAGTHSFAKLAKKREINVGQLKTITFYTCNEQVVDEADSNGLISSYLGRDVRTIINLYPKRGISPIITTQYIIKNGKDVLGEIDGNVNALKSVRQYNPYGKEVDYSSSSTKEPLDTNHDLTILSNPYGYSGYYTDSESGLYYLNARYYSPELMRFISRDSYDLLNRYSYADGNPIINSDPSGHIPQAAISLFAKFLTQFINPIEMNGASVTTGPISISMDIINVALLQPEIMIENSLLQVSINFGKNLLEEESKNASFEIGDKLAEKEIFFKNCKDIHSEIISKIKYSSSVYDKRYRKYVDRTVRTYRKDSDKSLKRMMYCYNEIKSGKSNMSELCFETRYGNCDYQAMVVIEQGEKYGYRGAIHSRCLYINEKKSASHYFAHLSDGKGNKAILDTWAGKFIRNDDPLFREYYTLKDAKLYEDDLNNEVHYNNGILEKFNFGNINDDSFEI